MIKESKYCSDVMKNYFNKELVMTKGDNENLKSSTKCWICDDDVKIIIVTSYQIIVISIENRGSAHIDCNINIKSNHKVSLEFHNLKK